MLSHFNVKTSSIVDIGPSAQQQLPQPQQQESQPRSQQSQPSRPQQDSQTQPQQSQHDDLSLLHHPLLKDGKLNYQELKLRPESHPYIAEDIIRFRSKRQQMEGAVIGNQQRLEDILLQENDTALISMLVQDSDETLPVLTSRLNEILSPFNRIEQVNDAYLGLIERTIRSVASRQKYGLDLSMLNQTEQTLTSIPSHLSISRWEVEHVSHFPPDYQAVLAERRTARQQMSTQLTHHYSQLPPHLQHYLLFTRHRKTHTSHVEEMIQEAERRSKHEEKQKKKGEEKQKREEEKQKREEDRLEEKRKRDEEKQKREEDRLEEKRKRDEDKKKKEQSQLRLTSLFTKNAEGKGTAPMENDQLLKSKSMFPPFFVKDHVNMYMVESIHKTESDLTSVLASYSTHPDHPPSEEFNNHLRQRYLQELASRRPELTCKRRIKRQVDLKQLLLPTSTGSNLDSIHRPENESLLKMKLLQFTEDVRPAYYGTWTKSSNYISPKNPFAKDSDLIEYDYDSEAEWEPEGEGEDIQSGDEDEDDLAPEATDPEDIGWLVPEGYLSEGEGLNDSEDDGMTKIVQRLSVRPKSRKNIAARPIVVGPIYENDDDMDLSEPLHAFGVRMLIDTTGYDPFATIDKKSNTTHNTNSNDITNNNKTQTFNQEHTSALINIIHDKTDSMTKIITKAKADPMLCDFSKAKIEAKLKDVAIKEKRGSDTKSAWYVKGATTQ